MLAALLITVVSMMPQASGDWPPAGDVQRAIVVDDSVRSAWIGVSIQDITSELAKAMKLKSDEGALVNEVHHDSPAEKAGIQEKDVVIEFDGRKIYDSDDLVKAVKKTKVGTKVKVALLRNNERKTVEVTVGETPRRIARLFSGAPRVPLFALGTTKNSGIQARELNEQLAEYFQAPDAQGVYVEWVEKGSTAEKAGMKAGDVFVSVNRKKIRSLRNLWRALDYFDPGEAVEVEVLRKGSPETLTLEVEERRSSWFEFETGPRMFRRNVHPNLEHLDETIRFHLDTMKGRLKELKHRLPKRIELDIRKHLPHRIRHISYERQQCAAS